MPPHCCCTCHAPVPNAICRAVALAHEGTDKIIIASATSHTFAQSDAAQSLGKNFRSEDVLELGTDQLARSENKA